MRLRWRIMGATVFVIVLTVLISVGVGYYATQSRLGVFVDEISNDEANQLARPSLLSEAIVLGGPRSDTSDRVGGWDYCPEPPHPTRRRPMWM